MQPMVAKYARTGTLDQGFVRHKAEKGSGSGLRWFARKAKLVTLSSMPSEAYTGEDLSVPVRRRPIGQILAAVFSLAIAAFSIYILGRAVSSVSLSSLRQAIAATSAEQIAAAALLTVVSYLALTGYDGLALRQLQVRVPYKTTALASFTSYAISFTLGFPLITAGTVRYWIYSQAGLTASKVASLTVIAGVTFWFGNIFVLGTGLTFHARAISTINHLYPLLNMLMGIVVLGTILAYLVWVTIRRRHISIKGFRLELPGLGLTVGQIILGVIDQSAAAGALVCLASRPCPIRLFHFRGDLCLRLHSRGCEQRPRRDWRFRSGDAESRSSAGRSAARFSGAVPGHLLSRAVPFRPRLPWRP